MNEPAPAPAAAAPPRVPIDPGAQRLVAELARAIGDRGPRGRPTTVSLGAVRNQSRASAAEFARFRERLVGLLDPAGRDADLAFVSTGEGDFALGGAAYFVTQRGYDQWELYLALRPGRDRTTVLWRADEPVRLLRLPRAGGPQVMLID